MSFQDQKITSLFNESHADVGELGSESWKREVFARAYGAMEGEQNNGGFRAPFEDVVERLRKGSVLVYVPSKCIGAAAKYVNHDNQWVEYGQHPQKRGETMFDAWKEGVNVFATILGFLKGNEKSVSRSTIFHNLDFMVDAHGNLHSAQEVQAAYYALVSAVRAGTVLGLASREDGRLPSCLERPFTDIIWLREIPRQLFHRIIPLSLGRRLADGDRLRTDKIARLHSHLRWMDPIAAVEIMCDRKRDTEENEIFKKIWWKTRTIDFELVSKQESDDERAGFNEEVLKRVQCEVEQPYEQFLRCPDSILRERLPAGVVLEGPPGTGKTTLARIIAANLNIPVQVVHPERFKQPDWGAAERAVSRCFADARRAAPCMLVLDDADDILQNRDAVKGAVAEAEIGVVNAILQEIQGFKKDSSGVLLVLTTNRVSSLDNAALKRFDLHLRVPFPTTKAQIEALVKNGERRFGLTIDEATRKALVDFFWGPTRPGAVADTQMNNVETRRKLDTGLFAARDIVQAMRRFANIVGANGPEGSHVKQLKGYYGF
ncbi:ATP-binding protein [Candidatus Sumerlaeota bacterium]|nr:ATP-binding protein [Candidatus Sumerlaeota bacterium]